MKAQAIVLLALIASTTLLVLWIGSMYPSEPTAPMTPCKYAQAHGDSLAVDYYC